MNGVELERESGGGIQSGVFWQQLRLVLCGILYTHHIVSLSAETSSVQRPPALEVSVLIYIF